MFVDTMPSYATYAPRVKTWLQSLGDLVLCGASIRARTRNHLLAEVQMDGTTMFRTFWKEFEVFGAAVGRELEEEQFLISTSTGYIGWAHRRARPGDQIYVLSGMQRSGYLTN